jgi:hypothetical protein
MSEDVAPGPDTDQENWRDQAANLSKGPLISRKLAVRALIWSSILQTYEVLSNMLSVPGWTLGVAGFIVTAPEVWSRAKDAVKSWRGKR